MDAKKQLSKEATEVKDGKRAKDYTKYKFLGNRYGKSQLVLAVVRKYLEDHPEATVTDLKQAFPRKELGSAFEIVEPVNKAKEGRFFLKPEHILKADKKIAVSNQWSKTNINKFIQHIKDNMMYRIVRTAGS